jgi:hypothetical protein
MTIWKALVGRITLFAGPVASAPLLTALDLYQKVWEGNPDNFQSGTNPLMPTFASGKRDGLMVGCIVQPTRIDLNLTPPPPETSEPGVPSFALIENTSRLHGELERLTHFVGGSVITNSVSRVGLYLHFIKLTQTIVEANGELLGVMPTEYRVRITDEEDFVFQVNRPRKSQKVDGPTINFLRKWNVDRFQVFNIAIAGGSPVVDSRTLTPQQGQEFIGASVVFDFNTVPSNIALDSKERSSLLVECLTAAKEIQRDLGLNIMGF